MVVIDTSGILAYKDESHPNHAAVAAIVAVGDEELLLSPFVLAEADYMLASQLGHPAVRGASRFSRWIPRPDQSDPPCLAPVDVRPRRGSPS